MVGHDLDSESTNDLVLPPSATTLSPSLRMWRPTRPHAVWALLAQSNPLPNVDAPWSKPVVMSALRGVSIVTGSLVVRVHLDRGQLNKYSRHSRCRYSLDQTPRIALLLAAFSMRLHT